MAIAVGGLATQRCMSRILRAAKTEKTKEAELEEEKVEAESKPVSSFRNHLKMCGADHIIVVGTSPTQAREASS
jgi:hypothetical protein